MEVVKSDSNIQIDLINEFLYIKIVFSYTSVLLVLFAPGSNIRGFFWIKMKKKQNIEDLLNSALDYWDSQKIVELLRDTAEFFYLYYTENDKDWVKEEIESEDDVNIRLIRTVYLISKLAENHTGALLSFKLKFPKLWEKMEKEFQMT